jgi:hypothetical protein
MSLDTQNPQQVRRRCLLLSLWAAEYSTSPLHELQRELRVTHNIIASADLVRGDLAWLAEQGWVKVKSDVAQLTERGRDVAVGAAPWPGM